MFQLRNRVRPRLEGLEDRRVPAVLLNELSVNQPGTDTPWEYAEMRGTPSQALTDIYFVNIEGDGTTIRGTADFVQNLTGFNLGTNGLLVIKSTTGGHTIPAATTVVGNSLLDTGSGAFENGAITFMLIQSTTPIVAATDYDADDNGVLELPGDAVVLDSVGWFEGDAGELVYSKAVLTQSLGTTDAASRFTDSLAPTNKLAWYNGDLLGTDPFGVDYDPAEISKFFPPGGKITPGDVNSHAFLNNTPPLDAGDRLPIAGPTPAPTAPPDSKPLDQNVTGDVIQRTAPSTPRPMAVLHIDVADVVFSDGVASTDII